MEHLKAFFKGQGIAAAVIFMMLLPDTLRSGDLENSYYKQIKDATFTSEKIPIARKLGMLKTEAARQKLSELILDPSSWNREAAVEGLLTFKDSRAGDLLVETMLNDHMVDDKIEAALIHDIGPFYQSLIDKYRALQEQVASSFESKKNFEKRKRILTIIGTSKTPRGGPFLKSIIDDLSSEDREYAFKVLSENYVNDYDYIKGHIGDKQMRVHVLTYLLRNGTGSELPIFIDVITKKEESQYQLVAYKAVNKWGNDQQKHRFFLASLKENDEALVQGGIYIFEKTTSQDLKNQLKKLAGKGKLQETRIAAALRLRDYNDKDIVPQMVIILNEGFIHHERGGIDMFVTALTFGISSILSDAHQKHRKKSFSEKKYLIAQHLKKITGADNGTSYGKWADWAIMNGYTIRGANIIQYLFSGYKSRREQAVASSMKLLGFENSRDFFTSYGNFSSDRELSLKLADLLIIKGFLKDDEE